MNIYVSNLGFDIQNEDLTTIFAPFGEVSSAKIITDRITGRSRGFGFVEMPNDEAGNKAISELNGGTIEGRTISVTVAKPKESGYTNPKNPFKDNSSRNSRW